MAASIPTVCLLGAAAAGPWSLNKDELIVPLLMLLLGVVVGIGIIFLLLVGHVARPWTLREARWATIGAMARFRGGRMESSFESSQTGATTRWLAIASRNVALVQSTLGLHRTTPCSWEEGLHAAQEDRLFISPPVRGWILVMGCILPDPSEDVDKCFRLVQWLSRKFGRVQFFSANRAIHHHAWVLAERGSMVRAYAWGGETLWNQGKKTKEETDLGMTCLDYTQSMPEFDFSQSSSNALNTEKLPLLAARWSIDPHAIDARWVREHQGIAGELSPSIVY